MLERIVKLTIAPQELERFVELFKESKPRILEFGGCSEVHLLRAVAPPNVVFTHSFWESEAALEAYRNSDLFRETWRKVKPLFADKAEAWSVNEIA